MKRVLLVFMAAFILFLASACSDGSKDTGVVNVVSNDGITLEDLDGWWYLADGYPAEGTALVQMFRLDAGAGTWTTFDDWGEEYYVDATYLEDDGKLCLVFELGNVHFIPEGSDALLDVETGEVAFVMGEPPGESSPDGMDGKWYRNGDISAAYYLFERNTYKKIGPYVDPKVIESKPYRLEEQEYHQPDKSVASGISIIRDDPYALETFILSGDGTFFFIPYYNEFYMREDVIETAKGDEITSKYRLMSVRWRCENKEGYQRLELCDNDIFVYNQQIGSNVELMDSGTWDLYKDKLSLYFTDGSSEEFILSEDARSLRVERYGITFTEDSY